MIGAYVFINLDNRAGKEVVEDIKELTGVKTAHVVTGLHDVIAYVEANDLTNLGEAVLDKIRQIDGVARTVTCVCVDLD